MSDLDLKTAKALKGECEKCSRQAESDKGLCLHHLGKAASRQRAHRQKLANAGLCRDGCGAKVAKKRRPDGTAIPRRCKKCSTTSIKQRRDARRDNTCDDGVTPDSADPAFRRVARTKVERAYDKLVDGSERMIERTVFRTRGGQTRESMDADLIADVEDAVRLLVGFGDRLRKLRAVEGELGRIQRGEARAAAADPLLRAARLTAAVAASLYPDGWKLVRAGLESVAGRE